MEQLESYFKEFMALMDRQRFSLNGLDYSVLEKHTAQLKLLGNIGNSSISVYDLYKKTHVFSAGFYEAFGGKTGKSPDAFAAYLEQTVHPHDAVILLKYWTAALKLCYTIAHKERKNYKILNDYRIKNEKGEYFRIIDQHQILELDQQGNIWLVLSFIDICPDQDKNTPARSSIVNFKTGELIWLPSEKKKNAEHHRVKLSSREKQVLTFIKEGYLSKEIAEKLFLSVHTVNTHRQRILEKLNVDNSIEAIGYASDLGLLE